MSGLTEVLGVLRAIERADRRSWYPYIRLIRRVFAESEPAKTIYIDYRPYTLVVLQPRALFQKERIEYVPRGTGTMKQ